MIHKLNKKALIELFESKVVDSNSGLGYDYRDSGNFPSVTFSVDYNNELDEDGIENCDSDTCEMVIYFNVDGCYFLTFRNIKIPIFVSEYKKLSLLFKKYLKKYETKLQKEKEENDLMLLNEALIQKAKKEKRNILFEKSIKND